MEQLDSSLMAKAQDWLLNWESQDYKWEGKGLSKPFRGAGDKTMKEFWQTDVRTGSIRTDDQMKKELIEVPGKGIYHIAYLPPFFADGTPGRVEWVGNEQERLNRIFEQRQPHGSGHQYATFSDGYLYDGIIFTVGMEHELSKSRYRGFDFCWLQDDLIIGNIENRSVLCRNSLFESEQLYEALPHTTINGDIQIEKCTFLKKVSIIIPKYERSFRIEETKFKAPVEISHSKFSQAVYLHGNSYFASFAMSDCNFIDDLRMQHSIFDDDFLLNNIDVQGKFLLYDTEFGRELSIDGCDFFGRCFFANCNWPDSNVRTSKMNNCEFKRSVDFSGSSVPPITAFNNAKFDENVCFDSSGEEWDRRFESDFEMPFGRAPAEGSRKSRYFTVLEGGCRKLRQLAVERGDSQGEHKFHKFELLARRETGDQSRAEGFFSKSYELLADYGLSFKKPFGYLLLLMALMGPIYGFIANGGIISSAPDWSAVKEGVGFSFDQSLPIGLFEVEKSEWREQLLGNAFGLKTFFVRLIASIQTILSLILIYLGVMAVRRKFKIG